MQGNSKRQLTSIYLDVSEFILKECSPLFKPISSEITQIFSHTPKLTPDVGPIDHDTSQLVMSPFFGSLGKPLNLNISENLPYEDQFQLEGQKQKKHKKIRKSHQIKFVEHIFNQPRTELDLIIEEAYHELSPFDEDSEEESSQLTSQQLKQPMEQQLQQLYIKKTDDYHNSKEAEQQKQSTNISMSSENQIQSILQNLTNHYKAELIQRIKQIAESKEQITHIDKLNQIHQKLSKYLFDYELDAIKDMWMSMECSAQHIIFEVVKVVETIFRRKIGIITFENRRFKLLKYLQKKKRRSWKKKVSYDCRRKVADGRLRIKGKFVTKEQVLNKLGLSKIESITQTDLKKLLVFGVKQQEQSRR